MSKPLDPKILEEILKTAAKAAQEDSEDGPWGNKFVRLAVNNAPALVAEIRRLEADLKEAESVIREVAFAFDGHSSTKSYSAGYRAREYVAWGPGRKDSDEITDLRDERDAMLEIALEAQNLRVASRKAFSSENWNEARLIEARLFVKLGALQNGPHAGLLETKTKGGDAK